MVKNKIILYLGYYLPEEKYVDDDSLLQNHANRLEKSIIDNLRFNNLNEVIIMSGALEYIKSTQHYVKDYFIKKKNTITNSKLPYVRDVIIIFRVLVRILKLKKRNEIVFMTYNNHFHFQIPILVSNLIGKSCSQINILIDFPNLLTNRELRLKRLLEDLFSIRFYNKHKYYVFLSKPINLDYFFKFNPNYICYQYPIYETKQKSDESVIRIQQPLKKILYIGAFENYYCIDFIIELAKILPVDMIIEVYGRGAKEANLIKSSMIYPNLVFMGFKEKQFIANQSKDAFAFLLFTCNEMHNFQIPSKLFLYMAFKKPIITNGIRSLDSTYNDYLNPIKNLNKEKVLESLIELSNSQEKYSKYCNDIVTLENIFKQDQISNLLKLNNLIKESNRYANEN